MRQHSKKDPKNKEEFIESSEDDVIDDRRQGEIY